MYPATTQPTVQRGMRHVQSPSQIGEPPLVLPKKILRFLAMGSWTRRSAPRQDRANHRTVECGATLGRTPALSVELHRDLRGCVTLIAQLHGSGEEFPVMVQLLVPGDGTDQLVLAGISAHPFHRHVH